MNNRIIKVVTYSSKMTIKGLMSWIRKHHSSALKIQSLEEFQNCAIGIDISNVMYIFMSRAMKNVLNKINLGERLPTEEEIAQEWIRETLLVLILILEAMIMPILIIDGKLPKEKKFTQNARIQTKKENMEKMEMLKERIYGVDKIYQNKKDISDFRQCLLNSVSCIVTPSMISQLHYVLQSLGFHIFRAHGEAEKFCSAMCIEGIVAATYSRDIDAIAYGSKIMIKEMRIDSNERVTLETIHLDSLLQSINLNMVSLVDLCIGSGTDYNNNVPNIGVGKVYKELIKDTNLQRNIEGIINQNPKYDISHYGISLQRTRELLSYEPTGLTKDIEKISWQDKDYAAIFNRLGLKDLTERFCRAVYHCPKPQRQFPDKDKIVDYRPQAFLNICEPDGKATGFIITNDNNIKDNTNKNNNNNNKNPCNKSLLSMEQDFKELESLQHNNSNMVSLY
jgi:flap endonuclease-1